MALESLAVQQALAEISRQRDLDASARTTELSELATQLKDEKLNLRRTCQDLFDAERKLEQLPAKAKEAADERERLLVKRRQLQDEIQKKLDGLIQAIIAERSRSPEVVRLTKELEVLWSEHATLSDLMPRIEQRIRLVREEVNRKRIVASEFRARDRDRGVTGLEHQQVLYALARRANAALADKKADLDYKLQSLETERRQCLRRLRHTI
jgi:hypothetical protein